MTEKLFIGMLNKNQEEEKDRIGPSPYTVDMNKYARFDEIPSMTLKDIKETKRNGRTDDGKT